MALFNMPGGQQAMSRYQGILFDLDGTLIDTAPDMGAALNALREQHQRPPLPMEKIRPWVSHGGAALIKLGFADKDERQRETLRQQFLQIYQENLSRDSRLFDGIAELLQWIGEQSLQWGIVTNKPGWLTEPLLSAFDFPFPYRTLVCGDTLPQKKPHPMPLLEACKQMELTPQQCVYIGDAQRDMEAARAANMHAIIAAYGYIEQEEPIANWQAEYLVYAATEIVNILKPVNKFIK